MPIDLNAIGRKTEPFSVRWTAKDAIIYALGVGAGASDPSQELAFTTQNTAGTEQLVLPTFPVALGFDAPRLEFGEFDRSKSVHAEQTIIQHEPLKPDGEGVITRELEAIYDKGSGALIVWTTTLSDRHGRALATQKTGAFVRGEGGFGGDRGQKSMWAAPERAPDATIEQATRPDQALIYRLSGDLNPLHTDPAYAAKGGFPRPILHGLCSYGFVARALLSLLDFEPKRLRSMKVRFSAPVLPGDVLTTQVWRKGDRLLFRTSVGERLVLDAGEAETVQ